MAENLTLNLVQVIFRHGLRAPLQEEAKFLNITEPSVPGLDFGELTKEGIQQEYKLGQLLRKTYNEHLDSYKQKEVVAKSTNSSRTKVSLELVLAGVYPPTPEEKWHPTLNWRPRSFDVTTGEFDIVLIPFQNSHFKALYATTLKNSEDHRKEISKYREFIRNLEKWTGQSYFDNTMYNCGWTYTILKIHKILNIAVPNWCTDEVYETITNLFKYVYKTLSLTPELKKLNGGTLIRQVIKNVDDNNRGADAKKIYLYSAHDLTLSAFKEAQSLVNAFELPPFGSAYIVESYKDSQNRDYIKMLSWDGSSDHFVELKIKDCDKYCPLEKYKDSVKDVIPTDEELKFFNPNASVEASIKTGTIVASTAVATTAVLLLAAILYKKLS